MGLETNPFLNQRLNLAPWTTKPNYPNNCVWTTKIVELSQDMRLHHDAWVVLLGTEMTMRCNVVVLQMIEHARIGGVCGQISFNSTLFMFETRRQTLPKVQQSHKATKLDEKYERELSTP